MGENNNIFDPSLLIDVITSVRLFAGVFYGGLEALSNRTVALVINLYCNYSQPGITGSLSANRRDRPMTGTDHRFVGQDHQLFVDAGYEGFVVATGQVSAANAASKKYVAIKDEASLGFEETDMAGGVARGEQDLKGVRAKGERVALS
jgi:hypothetical protein